MKILTWNLNHRTRSRAVPPQITAVIKALEADIAVFTEYVEGKSHKCFIHELKDIGLPHVISTHHIKGENQVLIASRCRIRNGNINPPAIAPSVPSNMLHVICEDKGFEILGLRIPDYSRQPSLRRQCWEWILECAESLKSHPFIMIGDFNTDPIYPSSKCGDRIKDMVHSGWHHALPISGSSYQGPTGLEKRLDHGFFTEHFEIQEVEYVKKVNGISLMGKKGALSDHAALLIDFSLRNVG